MNDWRNLFEENSYGNEGGIILIDEEYKGSCRITLERCNDHDAITVGVYGTMMHTVFLDS